MHDTLNYFDIFGRCELFWICSSVWRNLQWTKL